MYEAFMRTFREELAAVGVAGNALYGTHSFRHGGAQWLYSYAPEGRRMTLDFLVEWGGWTFSNNHDMIRYLLGDSYKGPKQLDQFHLPSPAATPQIQQEMEAACNAFKL